jgi:hypothetical protein
MLKQKKQNNYKNYEAKPPPKQKAKETARKTEA